MIQLNPYIPVHTPLGLGEAFALDPVQPDKFSQFYVFMDDTGIVCVFPHTLIRRINNLTEGINLKDHYKGQEEEVQLWKDKLGWKV